MGKEDKILSKFKKIEKANCENLEALLGEVVWRNWLKNILPNDWKVLFSKKEDNDLEIVTNKNKKVYIEVKTLSSIASIRTQKLQKGSISARREDKQHIKRKMQRKFKKKQLKKLQ